MTVPSSQPPPYPGPPSRTEHGSDDLDLSDDEPPSVHHLAVPHVEGMNDASRRSMEDEERDLPEGWIRQFDEGSGHQFFVDTKADPPRSIWTHPWDDEQYIKSIPDSQSHQPSSASSQQQQLYGRTATPSLSSSELKERRQAQDSRTETSNAEAAEKHENRGLGEKIKDKLRGSTKAERDQEKRKRIAAERDLQKRQQEQFLARRQALLQYEQQHRNDPDLQRYYASTSTRYAPPLMAYGRSPYSSGGYYSRRGNYGYGGGYGGMGMGMPLMMGGLGGLGAGMMLGGGLGGGGFGGGGFGGGDCGGGGGGDMGGGGM